MNQVNMQFLLSLMIIALGYISRRLRILSEKDGDTIARVIFNITLPALVIRVFSTMTVDRELLWLPVIHILYGLAIIGLGLFIFRNRQGKQKGQLLYLLPGYNIGLFAYPLVEAIWGERGLQSFGMFDMGNAIVLFGFSYLIAGYYATNQESLHIAKTVRKLYRSIPLVAYVMTLFLNLSGIGFPVFVTDLCDVISRANMPLSLLLLGIFLRFSFQKSFRLDILKVLAVRYSIGLIAGIAMYLWLPFDVMLLHTLLIGFLLPIGLSVIPYAVEFDYDKRFAGTAANITVVISFLIMWILVGTQFLSST